MFVSELLKVLRAPHGLYLTGFNLFITGNVSRQFSLERK